MLSSIRRWTHTHTDSLAHIFPSRTIGYLDGEAEHETECALFSANNKLLISNSCTQAHQIGRRTFQVKWIHSHFPSAQRLRFGFSSHLSHRRLSLSLPRRVNSKLQNNVHLVIHLMKTYYSFLFSWQKREYSHRIPWAWIIATVTM